MSLVSLTAIAAVFACGVNYYERMDDLKQWRLLGLYELFLAALLLFMEFSFFMPDSLTSPGASFTAIVSHPLSDGLAVALWLIMIAIWLALLAKGLFDLRRLTQKN